MLGNAALGSGGRPPRSRFRLIRLRAITAAAVIAAGVAGCGGSSGGGSNGSVAHNAASSGVIHLSLWESHEGATNPVAQTEQKVVNMFNSSQSKVQVKLLETSASEKALAAAQAGNPPLLAEVKHYDGQFRDAGLVIPLNGMMSGSDGFTSSELESFYPAVLSNGRIPQEVVGGKAVAGNQYRFPADVKVEELFYNREMFKEAGIASCPATWNALGEDLVKLKKLGVTPMGFKDASAHINSAFISNGGEFYKPGSNHKQTNYDSAAGRATFEQFRSWFSKGLFAFSHGEDMRAAMANKDMAIEDGTSAGWVKVRLAAEEGKVKVGACPYPAGISGHSGNILQGLGFVIFAKHSAAEQQAAFQFVKFWNEPSTQAVWARGSGFTPTVRSAVPLIGSSFLKSEAGAGLAVSLQEVGAPSSQPRGQSDNFAEVDSGLDTAFYNAVTGRESTSKALSSLDAADAKYLSGQTKI